MTAATAIDRSTERAALTAMSDAATLLQTVIGRDEPLDAHQAAQVVADLSRAIEALTPLAESAERLPDNVIGVDFAARHRARRTGGAP